ncbi:hypothetical protein [Streptomyces sp. NBC_01443]|uniref:hypothetical protein n=1 Tax=Streptomyces sp. NBC_01443 TaxID=2903868 RepID=UPI0022572020|nr:hypothetical protein [Streptomyces sp. NBC_01443]MCX4629587.1 hypothetical protein [Streptomyces sp. NBC_01443]
MAPEEGSGPQDTRRARRIDPSAPRGAGGRVPDQPAPAGPAGPGGPAGPAGPAAPASAAAAGPAPDAAAPRELPVELVHYLGALRALSATSQEGADAVAFPDRPLDAVWIPREVREIDALARTAPPGDEDTPGLPLDGIVLHGAGRSVVLIGPPCSGRTSICTHYASLLAERALDGDAEAPVPLLVNALDVPAQGDFAATAEAITDAAVTRSGIGVYGGTARTLLRGSLDRAFLFVDGVEDVPLHGHASSDNWSPRTVLQTLAQLHVHYRNLRVLVTISDSGWFSAECARARDVSAYFLRPPKQRDLENYITGWFTA